MKGPLSVQDIQQLDEQFHKTASTEQATIKKKGKQIGGVKGFLVNNLPAIGGGIGAIGGSLAAPVAGTVAGGAGGAAIGEALKQKLTGRDLDAKEIAIQAAEGGVLSGFGAPLKAAKAAKAATTVAESAAPAVAKKASTSFADKLMTQGRSAQGRVMGVSPGSKVAGRELGAADQARMLDVIKRENISTGNANNAVKDIEDRLGEYGKQIGDHFKVNNAPLKPKDTRDIAENFIRAAGTTDERYLKEARILADDLEKNVKDTKSLWEFRKSLDSRIPDSKQVQGVALSNQTKAIKDMRRYIADELGQVPGMQGYRDLAELKPFVSSEARRLNNPTGGIVGRIVASGPVQKLESATGKGIEKLGTTATGEVPAVEQGAAGFLDKFTKGNIIKSVGRQELGRGFGIPAAMSAESEQNANIGPDQPSEEQLLAGDTGGLTETPQETSSDPFDPSNVQANVQAILAQGGKMKDVADYIATVKAYQEIAGGTSKAVKKTESQRARDEAAQLTETALQQLNKGSIRTGLIGTKIEGINRVLGRADPETLDFNVTVDSLKAAIAKARAGTSFTPNEEKLLNKYAPTSGDTGQVLRAKLEALQQVYRQAQAREEETQYQPDAFVGTGL